jgi:L-malate glycosyltransferase
LRVKILHLVWNLIRGGTEGQCARVAMELARRGETHRVVVFRREGYFLPAVEQACGPVREIGITGMARPSTFWAISRLARQLRREKFDALHTWDADAAIFGQFVAARAGMPLITSRRDLGEIYPRHKLALMRRADRQAVRVVANAEAIARVFEQQGVPREKFRVIPNIVDVEELDRLAAAAFPRAAELPDGERLVMVARLDPEKDVATFLYAAELVLKQHPEASFVIAGDGMQRHELEAMARRHGLMKRSVFLGDTTDVPSLLTSCAIGVLTPSRNEGLSNTILEYMAAGLPVTATDCGGNRELVRDGQGGVIVKSGDSDALARALIDLLRHPEKRRSMGTYNRRRVEEEFRPGTVADAFSALYREIK